MSATAQAAANDSYESCGVALQYIKDSQPTRFFPHHHQLFTLGIYTRPRTIVYWEKRLPRLVHKENLMIRPGEIII